jgi:transposase InsO family protein
VLVELSVMEQRYQAVMEVLQHGATVTDVARRYGVSRWSVHTWIRRYEDGGIAALADRSHRPNHHPRQLASDVEALVCESRRAHPGWGPRRLAHELGRRGVEQAVSRSTIYRVLVRHHLVDAKARKRRRDDYTRWEREAPMQLWQMDIMGSVFLADHTELKLISGVDDHSRFCVIAKLVTRATTRAVCAAFAEALTEYGIPEEILTDNGQQFTGRFLHPRPTEVLFERILRMNGIQQRLTAVRSPTTTGKVERWHQTIRKELLEVAAPFADLGAAQAAVDAWRREYNEQRPHQALGMATPASRFRSVPAEQRKTLSLALPPQLAQVVPPKEPELTQAPAPKPVVVDVRRPTGDHDAIEVDRVVPSSGNLAVCQQQIWLGPALAGTALRLWIDTQTIHVVIAGGRVKTVPSRLTTADLARLRALGARPAGPPPAARTKKIDAGAAIEVDRTVNRVGLIGLGRQQFQVGSPLAGRRVTCRLEGEVIHVIADGVLVRTIPSPFTPERRMTLAGCRPAGPPPTVNREPVRVQRTVSQTGAIQVAKQHVCVGFHHAREIVAVDVHETEFHVFAEDGKLIKVVPRTNREEVTRFKGWGGKAAQQKARQA